MLSCVLQVNREHSDQEERKGMSKYRNHKMPAILLHLIVSLCVLFFPPHPFVPPVHTLIQTRDPTMEKKPFTAAANPSLSLPATILPSWLSSLSSLGFLYQGLLIEVVGSRPTSE